MRTHICQFACLHLSISWERWTWFAGNHKCCAEFQREEGLWIFWYYYWLKWIFNQKKFGIFMSLFQVHSEPNTRKICTMLAEYMLIARMQMKIMFVNLSNAIGRAVCHLYCEGNRSLYWGTSPTAALRSTQLPLLPKHAWHVSWAGRFIFGYGEAQKRFQDQNDMSMIDCHTDVTNNVSTGSRGILKAACVRCVSGATHTAKPQEPISINWHLASRQIALIYRAPDKLTRMICLFVCMCVCTRTLV